MSGLVQRNAPKRAEQLRKALERLGPTYVKVAQALSTRVDLLEPEYLTEIERLQDRVAPFPNDLVRPQLGSGLGAFLSGTTTIWRRGLFTTFCHAKFKRQ